MIIIMMMIIIIIIINIKLTYLGAVAKTTEGDDQDKFGVALGIWPFLAGSFRWEVFIFHG